MFTGPFLPLIKVAAVFVLMLTGIRFKCGLGNSILAGSLALGLLFGKSVGFWLTTGLEALVDPKALYLAAIVGFILVLSEQLEKSGQSLRLMGSLERYLKRPRLRLVFFPALIGMLPMPGGAVFSAPMLKSAADSMPGGENVDDTRRVLLNYWFRHVWEPAWPLYPGIILCASLVGMPVMGLVSYGILPTLFLILLGWVFFLRPGVLPLDTAATLAKAATPLTPSSGVRGPIIEGLPLLLAIGGAIVLEVLFSNTTFPAMGPFPGGHIDDELGVCIALALAIGATAVQNRIPVPRLTRAFFSKHLLKMLYVIAGIFVFKAVLQNAGVVRELSDVGGGMVALYAAAVFLPFLVGVVSGITLAYVGASMPLVLGLLGPLGLEHQTMSWVMLAMVSGFAGTLITPIHICFLLTCQFFEVEIAKAWRGLVMPCTLYLIFGVAYSLALRLL